MKLDRNMFCFGMHHWIHGDVYSTGVVTEYQNGLIIFHFYVLHAFLHLENLSTTCYCCNIFCLCYELRILNISSYLTKILNNHPSKRMLHLYYLCNQYFLPSLHLCRKLESNHFLLDTKAQNLLFL